MNYNYTGAEAYAKQIGLVWEDKMVENFDQQAHAFNFTQAQIDMALQHGLWNIRHVMQPKTYSFKQRVGIAFCFLLGKEIKVKK